MTPDFPGREPDEKIVVVLHRHWFTFFRSVIGLIFLGVVPAGIVWWWAGYAGWELIPGTLGHTLLVMAGALFELFVWILIYGFWLDYYLDTFIITDKRLVDIEQSGLLGRTVAEQRLYRVQDVTSEAQGLLATMFHFGNVYVQTAGEKERFIFEQVPNPEKIARTILAQTDKIDDRLEKNPERADSAPSSADKKPPAEPANSRK